MDGLKGFLVRRDDESGILLERREIVKFIEFGPEGLVIKSDEITAVTEIVYNGDEHQYSIFVGAAGALRTSGPYCTSGSDCEKMLAKERMLLLDVLCDRDSASANWDAFMFKDEDE